MFRTMTVVVALAATAVLAGCGTAAAPAGPTTGKITVVAPTGRRSAGRSPAGQRRTGPGHDHPARARSPTAPRRASTRTGNEDDSSLTAVGWERAHALVGLFDPAEGDPRPGLARPRRSTPRASPTRARGSGPARPSHPLADALGLAGEHRVRQGRGEEAHEGRPRPVGDDADLLAAQRDPRHRRRLRVRDPGPAAGVAVATASTWSGRSRGRPTAGASPRPPSSCSRRTTTSVIEKS